MRLLSALLVAISGTPRLVRSVLVNADSEGGVLVARQRPAPPPAGCLNSESKLCWDGINDIATNYYEGGPRTGNVVEYVLDIRNGTLAPDGRERQVLTINGTIPGPTLVANWGDTVRITVRNSMQHNGTSIHWHGIRMHRNFINDGVNGVGECAIAPGDEKVYEWVAEQYGTSWYHSHHTAQYGDGVWGAIQINGPATAEYDIDLGPIALNEWFYPLTGYQAAWRHERGAAFTAANFLVNGVNVDPANTASGSRAMFNFVAGKKHRLRFINTSVNTFFRVSLDGHNMTVIQTDFVPIVPYTTQSVGIAIGQRYDVIIEANQEPSNYWLRTMPQAPCSTNTNTGAGVASAFVRYDQANATLPTTSVGTLPTGCNDPTGLEPYVSVTVDSSDFPGNNTQLNVSAPFRVDQGHGNVFRWSIGPSGLPMDVDWANPSVLQLQNGANLSAALNSFYIDGAGASTAYWVIQNLAGVAHPIHLHLHDMNVVAQGAGTFNASTTAVQWVNPPRRDVAMLPGSGYLVLAFKADNPGIGIMHCHIAWHVSEGLSLQLVERASEIFEFTTLDTAWHDTCSRWTAWSASPDNVYGKSDSGLRTGHGAPSKKSL